MLIKARCEYLENQGQIVQDPLKRLNEQLNENDNPVIILNYLKKDIDAKYVVVQGTRY